jgi:hypothetical protein
MGEWKMTKSKTTIAIAILIFAMAFSLFALPTNAQGTKLRTYPFVDAISNPAGVGEQVLIKVGILQQAPNVVFGYTGLTVTVVKPDGTTETLGPVRTDSTGGSYVMYTPNEAGTYKLTGHFPEQIWTFGDFLSFESGAMILNNTVMAASDTAPLDLVVHQEPSQFYPGHALPAEYWTRPIDPQLREWAPIAGNWVARPDNGIALANDDAPNTAHVLWVKQLTTGGLTGDVLGTEQVPASSETGDAYEGKFPGSVIMNGILYFQRTDTRQERAPAIIGIDLHTGQEIFFKNTTTLSFGQVFYFNSWNYDGVYTYLWETVTVPFDPITNASAYTKWNAYDPFTGNWQYSFRFLPSGTRVYGPHGEILIYQINYNAGWMALWNSTAAGHAHLGAMGPDYGSWGNSVHGSTWDVNVSRAYSWNVSIPTGLLGGTLKIYPDRIVGLYVNRTMVNVWALSLTGQMGQSLYNKFWNAPTEWLEGANTVQWSAYTNQVAKGVVSVWDKELRKHYGFSVETGNYMWETDSEHFLDAYGWGAMEHTWYFAYGKLFSVGVGGILYAYDDQTGDTAWTYTLNDPFDEAVTGNNWWGWIQVIADGKVYVGHLEHSAEQPIPRGAPYVCVNASNGAEIWRVNGMFRATRWGGNSVMGDSIIATMDTYDQRVYSIGKGPSATTAVASPEVSVHGSSVLVKGRVTDTSPGTEEYGLKVRFPNGVPAVSDASQSQWMLYVYKQFEQPLNATGVEVIVEVFDPNNNYYEVGRTTSDASGFYSLAFTPEVTGKYTIVARFAGSQAYYGSFTETAIKVDEAVQAATPEATQAPTSIADQYFLPMSIGMIAAIAVVGAIVVLMLRKK